jgi:hypothetical protein
MKHQNFTTTISVDQTPQEAFAAINNVRGWWSGQIEGDTDKLGAEFTYRYQDVHRSTQKITELIPGKRVVWHVLGSHLSFLKDKASGTAWTLFSMSLRKRAKRMSALRTWVWCPNMSATVAARTRGAGSSAVTCAS